MSNLKIWAKVLHWVLGLHICDSRYGQQRAAVLERGPANEREGSLTDNRTSKELWGGQWGSRSERPFGGGTPLGWGTGAIRRALHTERNAGLFRFWEFQPATPPWRS